MKQIIMLAYYLRAFYELSRLKALLHFQKICLHKNCIASENCVILTAHWRLCFVVVGRTPPQERRNGWFVRIVRQYQGAPWKG